MLKPNFSEMRCRVCSWDAGASAAVQLCDFSRTDTLDLTEVCQTERSCARSSQESGLMSQHFKDDFKQSLQRFLCPTLSFSPLTMINLGSVYGVVGAC